jgi:hypothetical protein
MMRWVPLVILALILAACGDDQQQAQRQTPARTAADTTAAPVASAAPDVPGQVRHHPEGGFSIYWPAGCNRITISESGRQTRRAEREAIFSCVGPDASYSVRKLEMAHDVHGDPAHPRLVVSLIEEQLNVKTMRIVRQRPLEQGAIQGVDVHAEGKDTRQRAWYRGLLVGHDIFLFMVIGEAPDLFERAETQDFLNSFQLD